MMTGRLFIDGNDAYTEYGVYVEDNGLCNLIQFPAFKKLDSTDWPDEDGEEFDLTAPVLDTRSFQLSFAIANVRYAEDLFDTLSNGAYHEFNVPALGKTWILRMTTNGTFETLRNMGKFTVTFCDDFPEVPKLHGTPASAIPNTGYSIDGNDVAKYGIRVLKGSMSEMLKVPSVKKALEINSRYTAGTSYDGKEVFFKPRDITLQFLLKAKSVDAFWQQYDALFHAILQPEMRTLEATDTDFKCFCFYSNQRVTRFNLLKDGGVWCNFALTMKAVSLRPSGTYLLATEASEYVTTEDEARIPIRARKAAVQPQTATAATDADAMTYAQAAEDVQTPIQKAASFGTPTIDRRKKITELPESSDVEGLYTIGVDAKNDSVKVPISTVFGNSSGNINRYKNIPYAPFGTTDTDMGYAAMEAAEVRLNASSGKLVLIPQSMIAGGSGGGLVSPGMIKGYTFWGSDKDLQNGIGSEDYKLYGNEIYVDGDIWQFNGQIWTQINSAGQHKEFTKYNAEPEWTIIHNMGRRPSVSVVNAQGNEVECDVRYIDNDTVQLTFHTTFIGKAILN